MSKDEGSTAVLIVAAGRGRRLGDPLPKQYLPIAGVCSLRRCVDTFLNLAEIASVQVVIHPEDAKLYQQTVGELRDPRLLPPVPGGETRSASVLAGMTALASHGPGNVLVHDAARPFVSPRIIRDVMAALETAQGAFAALPVVDALWRSIDGQATEPVARDGLWRAQTPQGFHYETLLKAHQTHGGEAADDVAVARAMGVEVQIVAGDTANFKVTTRQDLQRAEQQAAQAQGLDG